MLGIQFKKLFNRFDYDVTLKPNGLTIITGPNGYGKSTILRTIEAMGKEFAGLPFFADLDFETITARFERGNDIYIKKTGSDLVINGVTIALDTIKKWGENSFDRRRFIRLDDDTLLDRRSGREIKLNDYIGEMYGKGFPDSDDDEQTMPESSRLPEILRQMGQLVGEIYFIREQRLIREVRNRYDEQETIDVIEELPDRFKSLMSGAQQAYSTVASKLDSTYPNRLFGTEKGISEAEYNNKMQEMSTKLKAMSRYDLSTMQEPGRLTFKKEHAKALKVYFEDFEEKYRAYEDFIDKLDLYTDIMNNRLSFKTVKISKEFGISVMDDNNRVLRLSQLSSGEKQEIVPFYELIFGTQKKVLLLIDEPEISLHIAWQKKFMNDLLKIIEYKGFNVIVATHSPQMISGHWDSQIDLGELYGKEFD